MICYSQSRSCGNIVEKLVKPGTNLRFVPNEELFDAIHEAHVERVTLGEILCQNICQANIIMWQLITSTPTDLCVKNVVWKSWKLEGV